MDYFQAYLEEHKPSRFVTRFEVSSQDGDFGDYITYNVVVHYEFDSGRESESDLRYFLDLARRTLEEALEYASAKTGNISLTNGSTHYSLGIISEMNDL